MEYVYAALLLHKAGQPITEEKLKRVIDAAGVEADAARVKAIVSSLEGVNIDEALKSASSVAVQAAPSAPASGGAASSAESKKKDEPSEADKEKAEESASAGLAALFG